MAHPKNHCFQCGAKLSMKQRVMQTTAKCPQCGTLHKPPTYWESLDDGEKVYAVFFMTGVGCAAAVIGFLLLLYAIPD